MERGPLPFPADPAAPHLPPTLMETAPSVSHRIAQRNVACSPARARRPIAHDTTKARLADSGQLKTTKDETLWFSPRQDAGASGDAARPSVRADVANSLDQPYRWLARTLASFIMAGPRVVADHAAQA